MADDPNIPHNTKDNPATNPEPDKFVGSRPQPGQTGPNALPPEQTQHTRPSGNPRGGAERQPGTAKDDPGKGIPSPQPTRDAQGQPVSKPTNPQGKPVDNQPRPGQNPNQGKPGQSGGPKGR